MKASSFLLLLLGPFDITLSAASGPGDRPPSSQRLAPLWSYVYTATSRLSFESEITTGLLKKERSLLNSAVILYTIPPGAPWYFHPPIKASGAKGAKTNTPAIYLYWTFDQAFYLCRIGTNTTALRSNSWAAAGQQLPCTDQIYIHSSYPVQPHNSSRVGKKSVLFGKTELDKEKRVLDRNNGQQKPQLHR